MDLPWQWCVCLCVWTVDTLNVGGEYNRWWRAWTILCIQRSGHDMANDIALYVPYRWKMVYMRSNRELNKVRCIHCKRHKMPCWNRKMIFSPSSTSIFSSAFRRCRRHPPSKRRIEVSAASIFLRLAHLLKLVFFISIALIFLVRSNVKCMWMCGGCRVHGSVHLWICVRMCVDIKISTTK